MPCVPSTAKDCKLKVNKSSPQGARQVCKYWRAPRTPRRLAVTTQRASRASAVKAFVRRHRFSPDEVRRLMTSWIWRTTPCSPGAMRGFSTARRLTKFRGHLYRLRQDCSPVSRPPEDCADELPPGSPRLAFPGVSSATVPACPASCKSRSSNYPNSAMIWNEQMKRTCSFMIFSGFYAPISIFESSCTFLLVLFLFILISVYPNCVRYPLCFCMNFCSLMELSFFNYFH